MDFKLRDSVSLRIFYFHSTCGTFCERPFILYDPDLFEVMKPDYGAWNVSTYFLGFERNFLFWLQI